MVATETDISMSMNSTTRNYHQSTDTVGRTRHVLESVIHSSSTRYDSLTGSSALPSVPSNQHSSQNTEPVETAEHLPTSFLYNKTWNIHKTSPFYGYDQRQWIQYENELLSYIAANSKNMASSALTIPGQFGATPIINNTGIFPGQIDRMGNNLVEAIDDLGDIRGVKFQPLNMQDTLAGEAIFKNTADSDAIAITITVRVKGRTKDQPYYCVLVPDQRHRDTNTTMPRVFTHFGVILFKAPAMFTQLLTQWFERRFDCRTSHLVFQTYDLRKIVESSLEISYNHAQGDDNGNERPIEFYYSLPQTVSALKTISVSLAPDDVRQLFVSRVKDSKASILDGIEAHCSDSMKIDFSRLILSRAGCSSWYIASEGKIKVFSNIAAKYSLTDFIQVVTVHGT